MSPTSPALPDDALSQLLTARLGLVEERLRDAVTHADALADTTSRHLVNAGGKRLRPLLTLMAAQLGEGLRPEVIDAAVVVELTHLADPEIGVLLTGMGDDGAETMARIRREGGHTIAQDEETSVVWGMPGSLAQRDGADLVAPLSDISRAVVRAVRRRAEVTCP